MKKLFFLLLLFVSTASFSQMIRGFKQSPNHTAWQVNLETIIDGDHDSTSPATLEVFANALFIIGNNLHAGYTSNSPNNLHSVQGDDLDFGYMAIKNLNDGARLSTGFTKTTSPKIVLGDDEPDFATFPQRVNRIGNDYVAGLLESDKISVYHTDATSTDGINFTKSGVTYLSSYFRIFRPFRKSDGNWIGIATHTTKGVFKLRTSSDGRTWSGETDISLNGISYVEDIIEWDGIYYIYGSGTTAPLLHSPTTDTEDETIHCYSTTDFSTFTYRGIQLRIPPSLGNLGAVRIVRDSTRDRFLMLLTVYKYRWRHEDVTYTNRISSVKICELNDTIPVANYFKWLWPSYLKRFYALRNFGKRTFNELVTGQSIPVSFTPSFTTEDQQLIANGSNGIPFPAYVHPTSYGFKQRVEGGTTGTQPLYYIPNIIYVGIYNDSLEVKIGNGTTWKKHYRSLQTLTRETGLGAPFRDKYNSSDVGFTWSGGVLKLFIENNECTVTQIQNDAITNLGDATGLLAYFLQGDGTFATIEAGNVSLFSEMTETEYINHDML